MTDSNPRSESQLSEQIASIDVQAPAELHRRVQAMADEASARRTLRSGNPLALRLSTVAVALAALIVALVLVLGHSTGPRGLSVEKTAGFALSASTMEAPAEDPTVQSELDANVEGIAFPYWDERLGWKSSGSRTDRYDGRAIRTVFYSNATGRQVGYAIVAGSPAPSLPAGSVHWVGSTPYHLSSLHGAGVVSWIRAGHLCVVTGRGVSTATLLGLASWQQASA